MARIIALLCAFVIALTGISAAFAFELKPYKEKIFKYRKPIESADNGDFLRLPYDPLKDINGRDKIPVRQVKGYYISSKPKPHQKDLKISANGRDVTYLAVGQLSGNASMTVIFLHGRDGSRHLGFSDAKFGGNFNRAKNLMYRNNGIYISTDFADFEQKGMEDVRALATHYAKLTKGPVVISCASMGAFLCWRLMKDAKAASVIDGYMIVGGFPDPDFVKSRKLFVPSGNKPIYFAHGSIDSAYSWKHTYDYYAALRKAKPGYPVRYALFDGGKHGTPVRMVDWRLALNWILAQ